MSTTDNINTEQAVENSGLKLEARVRPIAPQNNLMAFASIKIEDCFVVNNLKVVDGKEGLFVSMPSALGSDAKYHDVCFPTTATLRQEITNTVLEAYDQELDKMQEVGQAHEAARPSIKEKLQEGAKAASAQTKDAPVAGQKRAAEAVL